MQKNSTVKRFRPLPKAGVLISEKAEEYEKLLSELEQELEPRGVLEKMFVERIAQALWEIRRYERCKSAIINASFGDAIRVVLGQAGVESEEIDELAGRWFTESEAKKEVAEILRQINLDEHAIEAEAVRGASAYLESLEKLISSLETRLNTRLLSIAQYRDGIIKLRGRSDPMIEGQVVRLPRKQS